MNVYKIVLTGGPCAGKTKVIEALPKRLEEMGYYVIVVPETASEFIRSKMKPRRTRKDNLLFQELLLNTQLTKEKTAEKYAESIKSEQDVVILYDRAIIDNRAYLSQEDYDDLLRKYNINEIELMDKYDLVINLISTATAKKDSYELNDVRKESIEESSYRDKLTSLAWSIHRNLKVVKPTDTMDEKIDIVLNYIFDLTKNNQKIELNKFEVDENNSDLSIYNKDNSKKINIKKIYLNSSLKDGFNHVITKKQYNGYISYDKCKCNDEIVKDSSRITKDEYLEKTSTYGVNNIKEYESTVFIDNGNYYRLVNNNDNVYLETNIKDEIDIPNNITLKQRHKTLIK